MDSINSPDEMMQIVKNIASKIVGQTLTGDLKRDLTADLSEVLKSQIRMFGLKVYEDAVKFEKDPEDEHSMIPANLYTLLLTRGILVDYEEVRDKTEYTMKDGTVIVYKEHSCEFIVKPVKPLKYIRIDFTISLEKINFN